MQQKNYYLILKVNIAASTEEIKISYRTLAKKFHPDKNNGHKATEDYFKEIQEAYSVLSNPQKRKMYDLSLPYGSNFHPPKKTASQNQNGTYTGNAYQYAQQQAKTSHQPKEENNSKEKKKDKTELNQILFCIAIALWLLYFIVSYNSK